MSEKAKGMIGIVFFLLTVFLTICGWGGIAGDLLGWIPESPWQLHDGIVIFSYLFGCVGPVVIIFDLFWIAMDSYGTKL